MTRFSYRKIKYFSQEEAELVADRLNNQARRECMAGVYYEEEEESPGNWVVNKYVLRTSAGSLAKSGWLPYDYDPGYREGYHHHSLD
jgi:hypothetical protein